MYHRVQRRHSAMWMRVEEDWLLVPGCPSWAERRRRSELSEEKGHEQQGEQSGQQPEAGRRLACLGAEQQASLGGGVCARVAEDRTGRQLVGRSC